MDTKESDRGFAEIPTIDLSLSKDPSTLPRLLTDLRYALTEVGFLYLSKHGVSFPVVNSLVEALPELFSLSPGAKAAIALENSPHFLGYSAANTETTAGRLDGREQVECATELKAVSDPEAPVYERLRGPNQVSTKRRGDSSIKPSCGKGIFVLGYLTDVAKWPRELPQLERIVTCYIAALTELGSRFLELVAMALGLPRTSLQSYLSDQHRLKLVHYPALPADEVSCKLSGQGVGPHKDSSGWWTFLLQASPPNVKGLQVLNKAGEWIDVPPVHGTFVVNIGQAFEVVTHGFCKATTHRVLAGSQDRFSVPFFQGVRRDLTKADALNPFRDHFAFKRTSAEESEEGRAIDSAFLKGKYDTWGESQLRTKIRSHQVCGKKFYPDLFDRYVTDDS